MGEEDVALTKAWVRVSEDAIIGSDQKGEAFYRAVSEYFDTIKPSYCTNRNAKSVERRVRKLLSECLSFAACVARVTNAQPSGTNGDDVLHLATALYNKYDIRSVEESCGGPFKHLECWHLLKDHPKFDLMLNPPESERSTPQTVDEQDDNEEDGEIEGSEAESFRRPIGRKRSKALDSKAELDAKRVKIAKETLDAQKERNQLLRTQQEMLLFTSSVDKSDPIVGQYMSIMRKRALDRLKQSETSDPTRNASQSASMSPETPLSGPPSQTQ